MSTIFMRHKKKGGTKTVPPFQLWNVKLGRDVDFVGNVLPVLLALAHAFGKQIFDLSVDGTKIVLSPSGNLII